MPGICSPMMATSLDSCFFCCCAAGDGPDNARPAALNAGNVIAADNVAGPAVVTAAPQKNDSRPIAYIALSAYTGQSVCLEPIIPSLRLVRVFSAGDNALPAAARLGAPHDGRLALNARALVQSQYVAAAKTELKPPGDTAP